jgi:hypothetical protein
MWDEISVTGNEITYNEISDNNYGVYVKTSVTGTDISINYNNITGNTSYGVYNEDSEGDSGEDVDATYNWWGDASGPDDDAGIINGSGDKASIYVYCGSYVSALIEDTVTESTTVTTTTTTVTTDTDTVVRTRTSTSTIAEGTVTSLSFSTVTDTQVSTSTYTDIKTSIQSQTVIQSAVITVVQSTTSTTTSTATSTLSLTEQKTDWNVTIILLIAGLLGGGLIVTLILVRRP